MGYVTIQDLALISRGVLLHPPVPKTAPARPLAMPQNDRVRDIRTRMIRQARLQTIFQRSGTKLAPVGHARRPEVHLHLQGNAGLLL